MPLNMGGKGRGALALGNLELSRDMYGFAVRPQHLQRYREYAKIYKEEEEERSERWQNFLENYMDSTQSKEVNLLSDSEDVPKTDSVITEGNSIAPDRVPLEEHVEQDKENNIRQIWPEIKPSLDSIEQLLSFRIQKNKNQIIDNNDAGNPKKVPSVEEMKLSRFGSLVSEEDSEDEFYDVERSDPPQESLLNGNLINDSGANANGSHASFLASCGWQQELESLVRGGLPMALRKKLWQAFVGTKARKMDNYYNDLLTIGNINGDECINDADEHNNKTNGDLGVKHIEKWKSQIEKDLPRTFPGHPALDEDGRSALRRLLTAYARHNPSVGYCQAMNFFAGLLLLLMPEENAFWTLTGIIDDYFDGYYSEKMVESQVDQLAFEELARELFPRLVSHFDKLGVQVAWVTGPWFLSIFVNVLPWETVLRVWDVLLYEGNRTMLFRTALALLELYGPALLTTKDAGDAVTLLQSLAGSTFDSSQLVLTACMGYQMVDENRLQELREKHRPTVLAIIDERSKDPRLWKRSQNLPTKLYNDCNKGESNVTESGLEKEDNDSDQRSNLTSNGSYEQSDLDNLLSAIVEADNPNSMLDLQEQVKWLKNELCHALEEKRSAVLRAEELETALVEMVKEDNRRLLSAKLEEMESEVRNLQQTLAEKEEQERAMLEVMLRIEQEQKLTEDARLFAEQDAAAQRHAAYMLQEKYEDAVHQLALMEKRAIMAESMLDATLKSQALELKATKKVSDNPLGQEDLSSATESTAQRSIGIEGSPHNRISDVSQEQSPKKTSLLSRPFGLNWRDRNKVKTGSPDRQLLQSNSSDDLELKTDPAITENGTHLSQHSSNSVSDADSL